MSDWTDLSDNLRASGINLKWIGNDNQPDVWNIGGFMGGAQGAFISGPIKGLVHVPFKGIWHEPAYGPPRFERKVDERREVSMRIVLASDSQFGWFDTERRWWDGMDGETPGYLTVFTHRHGELYIPMQLLEAVQNELEDDPTANGNNFQEWDILLAADGEPRWRQPDVRPKPWINTMTTTRMVTLDDEIGAPQIEVGVCKFKVANRGTTKQWPIYTLEAPSTGNTPARYWISNGSTTEMIRVPPLNKGEHITVDTNPENRIAISALDPVDDGTKQFIRNADLLSWLFGQYGESGISILERFHGQGFDTPAAPRTVSTFTVYSNLLNGKVSVRLPQRFERAIS